MIVNRNISNITNLIIALLMLSPPLMVLADGDHVEARRLRNYGEILPFEVILKNVRQAHPGNLLEVELNQEEGRIVYEVEILGKDGVVKEIIIDARTGNILFAREDD